MYQQQLQELIASGWQPIWANTQRAVDESLKLVLPAKPKIVLVLRPVEKIDLKRYLYTAPIPCECGKTFQAWEADFCSGHTQLRTTPKTLTCPHCKCCVCNKMAHWEEQHQQNPTILQSGAGRFMWVRSDYDWQSAIHMVIVDGSGEWINFSTIGTLYAQCYEVGVPFTFYSGKDV